MRHSEVQVGEIRPVEGPISWRRDRGQLYVIEFDSGWIELGKSTIFASRRLREVRKEYASKYKFTVTRSWSSSFMSARGGWTWRDVHRSPRHCRR